MRVGRLILEVLYTVLSIAGAYGVGWAASWAYPVGRDNIWLITWISVAIVALMGVRPVMRAARGVAA